MVDMSSDLSKPPYFIRPLFWLFDIVNAVALWGEGK